MYYYQTDRFGFAVPFLVGAVAGGAAIGLTRPRPIVNTQPSNYYPYNSYGYYSYYNSVPTYPYYKY